jgi:hypothetical protein
MAVRGCYGFLVRARRHGEDAAVANTHMPTVVLDDTPGEQAHGPVQWGLRGLRFGSEKVITL